MQTNEIEAKCYASRTQISKFEAIVPDLSQFLEHLTCMFLSKICFNSKYCFQITMHQHLKT